MQIAQGPTGFHIARDKSRDPFLARLTGVYTLIPTDVEPGHQYAGMKAYTNLYSFTEQIFDASAGVPLDAQPGRQTVLTGGYPTSCFALEASNALLQVHAGDLPNGYSQLGPYVEMRLKGIVGGVPVYQFDHSAPSWGVVEVLDVNGYTVAQAISGQGLNIIDQPDCYACLILAGRWAGAYGWAAATNALTSGEGSGLIQRVTPVCSASYFGYWLFDTPQQPPLSSTQPFYPVFQLIWQCPFNYVQTVGGITGILASEPNFILDAEYIQFGPPSADTTPTLSPEPTKAALTQLAIQYGGAPYQGATGTDPSGNMFVSGLCVNVGAGGGGGVTVSGGSFW